MKLDKLIDQGKGIFVFSDPAGSNSIFSIVDYLTKNNKAPGKDFLIFTNKVGVFDKKYNAIVDIIEFNHQIAINIIKDFKPNFLFSATSNNNFEHLWRKSLTGKVKIYSFIDHWTKYIERFSYNNEIIFGDIIYVVNKIAKDEAILSGIPKNIIKIFGNPYYEKVRKFHPAVTKDKFFRSNKLNTNKLIVLFISENLRAVYSSNSHEKSQLGYDEYTVFNDLLECIINNKHYLNLKFQFVIKIHPKSHLNKFDSILKRRNVKNLDIITLRDCDSLTLNYFSDYVIGMHSNMVIESYLLGKKLLRVKTGQMHYDLMKFSHLKNKVITSKTKLNGNFKKFLNINDLTII